MLARVASLSVRFLLCFGKKYLRLFPSAFWDLRAPLVLQIGSRPGRVRVMRAYTTEGRQIRLVGVEIHQLRVGQMLDEFKHRTHRENLE